jgi:hypothetical protein
MFGATHHTHAHVRAYSTLVSMAPLTLLVPKPPIRRLSTGRRILLSCSPSTLESLAPVATCNLRPSVARHTREP